MSEEKIYQEPSDKGKWDMICPRCGTKYYSESKWHIVKKKDGDKIRFMCPHYGCRAEHTELKRI